MVHTHKNSSSENKKEYNFSLYKDDDEIAVLFQGECKDRRNKPQPFWKSQFSVKEEPTDTSSIVKREAQDPCSLRNAPALVKTEPSEVKHEGFPDFAGERQERERAV